jgi:hypothetical protein
MKKLAKKMAARRALAAPNPTTKEILFKDGKREVTLLRVTGGDGAPAPTLWVENDPSCFTIKVESRDRHRNGISGEPFYVLELAWAEIGQPGVTRGRAIVGGDSVQQFRDDRASGWAEHTFVLGNDSGQHFRGDRFGEMLVPYLAKLEDEEDAAL